MIINRYGFGAAGSDGTFCNLSPTPSCPPNAACSSPISQAEEFGVWQNGVCVPKSFQAFPIGAFVSSDPATPPTPPIPPVSSRPIQISGEAARASEFFDSSVILAVVAGLALVVFLASD